ncbi:MAG: prephenate dehydrogenase/arogenate dehydrogenase family protein [Ruminococcaceae bacterium]|nr:prephenate dehydrogenase/arogenate dehydrogenase family protein [Oscillospiraceae bacterium]
MELTSNTNILIVGLGVIGGGYASALTKQGFRVSCITKNPEDIAYAKERGMIRVGTTELDPNLIGAADLIIFAVYPQIFIDWVRTNQVLFKSGTLITDVTGVKGGVVAEVQSFLRPDVEFIAAHPMAGRERSGVEFSDDRVFKGANYIITPTEKNTPEAIAVCRRLGELLGFARISELSPAEHDETIAFLSQLTHCIAVVLMTCNNAPSLEKYTGDSFRDLTRIAKINDEMWSELFLWNRDALLGEMDRFSNEFARLRAMLETGDREGMREMMRASTERRALFDKPTV